jgi:hypothetical protein
MDGVGWRIHGGRMVDERTRMDGLEWLKGTPFFNTFCEVDHGVCVVGRMEFG